MLEERPVPLKVSMQDLIHCTSLSYGRLTFVVLNSQPTEAQLGAHFPISWHALLQISFVSHLVMYLTDQQEWPEGFPVLLLEIV